MSPLAADTPAQFAVKMRRAADGVKRADEHITKRAAMVVKREAQNELRQAAPSGRLNVGRRGQRVGVRFDMSGDAQAIVRMTGPAHLIERDTKAHRIPRERTARSRRNVKRLAIPGIGVRMSAQHPGTKGKQPWAKGLASALPKLPRAAADHYFDTIRKAVK